MSKTRKGSQPLYEARHGRAHCKVNKPDFDSVVQMLLPDEWTLRRPPGTDGYCWRKTKTIDVGAAHNGDDAVRLLLHEIAHIPVCCEEGGQHCAHWWGRLVEFHERYGLGLSGSDVIIGDVYGLKK